MAKGWRDGEHSVANNKLAMADAELQISAPCAVIKLDIPVKPIELSGRYSLSRMPRMPRMPMRNRTVRIPQRPKPKQVSKPTNAPKPNTNTYSNYK